MIFKGYNPTIQIGDPPAVKIDRWEVLTSDIVSSATKALAIVGNRVMLVARAFSDATYKIAEAAYLDSHEKLPGSDRTSRLRKKRRKAVLDWFYREHS